MILVKKVTRTYTCLTNSQPNKIGHFKLLLNLIAIITFFLFSFLPHVSFSKTCESYFSNSFDIDLLPPDLQKEITAKLIKAPKSLKMFPIAGDRLIIKLSDQLDVSDRSLLSPLGQQILMRAEDSITLSHIFKKIADQYQVPLSRVANIILDSREEWVHQIYTERNAENWSEMIRIYHEELNDAWRNVPEVALQTVLAYNRRNESNDRELAIQLAYKTIEGLTGPALKGEAYGILARIFKDMGDKDKAIETYLLGFQANPQDYYPGVAGLNLLVSLGTSEADERVKNLLPLVQTAVRKTYQRMSIKGEEPNYWLYATDMDLKILAGDWDGVWKILPDLISSSAGTQNLKTTREDLGRKLVRWRSTESDVFVMNVIAIIDKLQEAENTPQEIDPFESRKKSYVTTKKFPEPEGIFSVKPINVSQEIQDSAAEDLIEHAYDNFDVNLDSFHRFLQKYQKSDRTDRKTVLLAPTGPYKSVIQAIADQTGITPWWKAYQDLGIEEDPSNTPEFIDELQKRGYHIVMFIPRQFGETRHNDSYTYEEFIEINKQLSSLGNRLSYVFGFEEVFPLDYEVRISEDEVRENYHDGVMRMFLRKFQEWLIALGEEVKH